VDCSVTFYGNDYAEHTVCVSEAEKYEGALYKAKKTKLNPQEAWVALVEEAVERAKEAPAAVQHHLPRLGELGNVPRNKKKFVNFVKNSLRLYNEAQIDQIWTFLEQLSQEKKSAAPSAAVAAVAKVVLPAVAVAAAPAAAEEGKGEEEQEGEKEKKKKKKNKKSKREEEEEVLEEAAAEEEEQVEETAEERKARKERKREKKRRRQQEREQEEE